MALSNNFDRWSITVTTPRKSYDVELATYGGQEVAERRAQVTIAANYANEYTYDDITATAYAKNGAPLPDVDPWCASCYAETMADCDANGCGENGDATYAFHGDA